MMIFAAVSFKSQGEGLAGEKLQLQVGRHAIGLYEKNGQLSALNIHAGD